MAVTHTITLPKQTCPCLLREYTFQACVGGE